MGVVTPPCSRPPIFFFQQTFKLHVDGVTRAMSKGGGACECLRVLEWGYFQFFLRADDVTRTRSKGGGACECLRVGVFFNFFWRADDVTRTRSKGGVPVNVLEWGYFSIFLRADDVTRTRSKGGGACECLDPPLQEILDPRL